MGKPSRLNDRGNSSRQLYDRDKMPEGLDPEIWHLTLFFEQTGEEVGKIGVAGRPIVYTELSNRINASNIRMNFIHWSGIVEDMIDRFWNYELDIYKTAYAINEFCKVDTFDHLLHWIVDEKARQLLIDSADRVTQPDVEPQQSRRDEASTLASEIINRRYTHEELADKLRRFKERT